MSDKQITGKIGEDLACDYLKQQGYTIMDRNYWKKWGEIDIVARRGQVLHFIEVKSVTREKWQMQAGDPDDYEPEDNLHPWKRQRLARVIEIYLKDHDVDEDEFDWQVDALAVYVSPTGEKLKIEILEDILL